MATAAEAALCNYGYNWLSECARLEAVRAFLQGRAGTHILREDAVC